MAARSLARQIERAATANRDAGRPFQLVAASFHGAVAQRAAEIGGHSWHLDTSEAPAASLVQGVPAEKICVLAPDAKEVLTDVQDGVFIVGGIIDRTVTKYASVYYAQEHNFVAKRLPVQEHMHMVGTGSGRTAKWAVLNVDTVVQVLAAVRNGESWSTAFQEHVPLRKRRTHDPSATQKNRISDV